ncbi:MAG: diacylglycerol kinase family lipid kinase [Tissierellia bacterium]|nr:diacylglycerol kinase family lipid kinase [Tissierellia bacterium]
MERILFIINPIAGGGRAKNLQGPIEKIMEDAGMEYEIVLTTKPKDAIDITREKIKNGYKKIVAVGGDGTVNEVALGILEAGVGTLGIIPSGTGNDLARTLGIPFNLKEAINVIIKGNIKQIDVGTTNNNIFLNIGSVGFDAEVAKNTEVLKKRIRSGISYFLAIFVTLLKYKSIRAKLEIDKRIVDKDILLIAVGNGRYYGGGLKILPTAIPDDGYLHVCLVNKISKLKLLVLFPSILIGKHIIFKKYVEILKAKEVKIIVENPTYLNVDGEIITIEKETSFGLYNKTLAIFTGSSLENI